MPTAFGNTGNHIGGGIDIQLSGGEIIEEEKWFCALHNQIIDAHGNKVDTDSIVNSALNGDFQFGANTIISGNQNRIVELAGGEVEQSAKTAEVAISANAGCRLG